MSGPNINSGGNSKLERAVRELERFLNPFSKTRAMLRNAAGEWVACDILGTTPVPADGAARIPLGLGRDADGATIEFGELLVSVNMVGVSVSSSSGGEVRSISYQGKVGGPEPYVPQNLSKDRSKVTSLKWFGDVFLAWEMSSEGIIRNVKIAGPSDPGNSPLPQTGNDFTRPSGDGKYRVKLGSVPKNGSIEQDVAGNVSWSAILFTSSGSGGSSS